MTTMASCMETLHTQGQDNQNVVQYDFLGHVMSLTTESAYHGTDSKINGTINISLGMMFKMRCNMTSLIM